jgi:hypothetical protein
MIKNKIFPPKIYCQDMTRDSAVPVPGSLGKYFVAAMKVVARFSKDK